MTNDKQIDRFPSSLVGPPYTFRFRVKFYTSDPQNLHDELTRYEREKRGGKVYIRICIFFLLYIFRYLFVLQLKEDIRTGKLDCPSGSDVELAALSMQGK